jgi:hypothetical protein
MLTHPFNYERCVMRLKEEYHKYGKLIIAFDFDNTIYDYHNEGGDYSEVISLLRRCKELGFILILYTVEVDSTKISSKIKWCKSIGIEPDYINESPLFKGSVKPYYNILLDDRSGLEESYKILYNTIYD